MTRFSWISLATGLWSFGILVFIRHWWSAAAVGVILAIQVHNLLRKAGR